MDSSSDEWRSRMEMLGSTGAAVLGAGDGLLFRQALGPFAVPFVVTGLIAHGLGMYGKHRADAAEKVPQSLAVSLLVAGAAAFPLNRWLIARGRGHAVVHDHHHH